MKTTCPNTEESVGMSKKTENTNLPFIDYSLFEKFPEILAFTTTRRGGVSSGNYESFNLSEFSGDDIENVSTNRKLLCEKIDISENSLITPFQIHGDFILAIDKNFLSFDEEQKISSLNGKDALMTNLKGICIAVSTADCVPLLVYDSVNKAIAVIHAGWRGTCSRIVEKTIRAMKSIYHSNPQNLLVAIGPSISPEVYEVGNELIPLFQKANFDVNQIFRIKEKKLFLDLWKANQLILLKNGVDESRIEIIGKCTCSEPETFFSARRQGIQSGRMLTGILLQ